MPPKVINDGDQLRFLIACIRHSNNGKVNFDAVATDCEIVTKGAAAKRYERLMKAHGIHQSSGPSGRDTGVQPLKLRKRSTAGTSDETGAGSKKRKANGAAGAKINTPKRAKAVKEEKLDDHDDDAPADDMPADDFPEDGGYTDDEEEYVKNEIEPDNEAGIILKDDHETVPEVKPEHNE